MTQYKLKNFLSCVKDKILFLFENNNFSKNQEDLLKANFESYFNKSAQNPISDPLSIFYFISNNWRKQINQQAEYLAVFCALYIFSLDLFDDVQDEDLAGKTYEKAGPAIAINNAITLLFLAVKALKQAIELEPNEKNKIKYLDVFNRVSLMAVKGQHKDLMGIEGAKTPQEVLDMQKAKTSSISLVAECAAIFADCNDEVIKIYRKASEQMVLAIQIVDDIRDIYGKNISPDLITGKMTYPIACFLEISNDDQINKFNKLKKNLPDSIKEIRYLLHNSGAIEKSAETLEKIRVNIHKQLALVNKSNATTRTWLYIIDSFASNIYELDQIDETKNIIQPKGKWHNYINQIANDFLKNMDKFNPPELPKLLPWHLSQWMYDTNRNCIFYPDIEDSSDEILSAQSKALNIDDLDLVKNIIENYSPLIMVHELFHYWRNASGNITQDSWYEELAANSLAVAYAKEYLSQIMENAVFFINKIINVNNSCLTNNGEEILERLFSSKPLVSQTLVGYNLSSNERSIIQFFMVKRLYNQDLNLKQEMEKFLYQ